MKCGLSVLIVLLFLSFCGTGSGPDGNVVFITLDTMRADHLGCLNSARAETPNLDFLASRGITAEKAYSPIPITLPAHAALFYSRHPHEMDVYNNGQIFHPDPEWVSLAEIFRSKGFRTAAFISLGVLSSRFGLNRGFQDYIDTPHARRWYMTAGEINQRVFPWLEKNSHAPFFLWIHYSDPHDPYAPPSDTPDLQISVNGETAAEVSLRFREKISLDIPLKPGENNLKITGLNPFPSPRDEFRYSLNGLTLSPADSLDISIRKGTLTARGDAKILAIKDSAELNIRNPEALSSFRLEAQGGINFFPSEMRQGYREEVEYMDKKIGELLTKLENSGLMDKTLIVAFGDHGEGLGDYPEHRGEYYFGHIHYLKSVYTRVPLIITDPQGKNPGSIIPDPVSLLDIAPTVLSRMGWKKPSFYQGEDILKPDARRDSLIFQETYSPEAASDRFAGIQYPWHLIFNPEKADFLLYRLDHLDDPPADVYSRRQNDAPVVDLTRKVVEKSLQILKHKKEVVRDEGSLEMLKSLGYVK